MKQDDISYCTLDGHTLTKREIVHDNDFHYELTTTFTPISHQRSSRTDPARRTDHREDVLKTAPDVGILLHLLVHNSITNFSLTSVLAMVHDSSLKLACCRKA